MKAKFKGLRELFKKQDWTILDGHSNIWVCTFSYKTKKWTKARTLKAVRQIKKYETRQEFGGLILVPVYQYAAYGSTLALDEWATQEKYIERSVSGTWIEQVTSQLFAGTTLTNDFWDKDLICLVGT